MIKGEGLLSRGVFIALAILFAGCSTGLQRSPDADVIEWGRQQDAARAAYDEALSMLSKGQQKKAESFIAEVCSTYPDSQRLLFLSGVLFRSRFEPEAAMHSFAQAYEIEKNNVPGISANTVVMMGLKVRVNAGFRTLQALIDEHPNELLVRWLFAMEARNFGMYQQEAAVQFEYLLKTWKTAPVTLHQAYAKLLTTDLDQPEKALEHRILAAELEPEAWTYQGLANTLKKLERYEEADQVYAKLVEMEPDQFINWMQWGTCLAYMGDYIAATDKFKEAYVCNPDDVTSLLFWGRCLEKQGEPANGFRKYSEALRKSPKHPPTRAYAAHSALYGYGTEVDFEWALETCKEPGSTALGNLRRQVRLADQSDNPLAPEKSALLLKHLTALGEQQDPAAQYSLGMIYRYGIGVPEDEATAGKWFKCAAANGHKIAGRMMNPPAN